MATTSCGSDDIKIKETTGDPGPTDPEPTAAVSLEIYATQEQMCPVGNIHIDVGVWNAAPPVFSVNGEDGAVIACSVKPGIAGKFDASGSVDVGKSSFAFQVSTDGTSAVGEVEFDDPATGTHYKSNAMSPCVFQFAPGTLQGVKAGELFVQFDCANLINETDATATCSSRYGYIRIFNCEGAPMP